MNRLPDYLTLILLPLWAPAFAVGVVFGFIWVGLYAGFVYPQVARAGSNPDAPGPRPKAPNPPPPAARSH